MQIALTRKLADTMKIKPRPAAGDENLLFTWTANWTKVWDHRRANDMLVLVNNANRFAVAIYQVKRKDLEKDPQNIAAMMTAAISNTLLSMNINPKLVEKYMRLAGAVDFVQNRNRKAAAWVSKAGLECSFYVDHKYHDGVKVFDDTVGVGANYCYVSSSVNNKKDYLPRQAMMDQLSELTGLQIYKYRAFELLVTLDLKIYKAMRRLIVPANIRLTHLHEILQSVFDWKDYHLYDFIILDNKQRQRVTRIVPFEENLEYDEDAILMEEHTLSDFFPEYKHAVYTYDLGDNWKHEIQLARVIDEHDQDSPYLLEAIGQTPPEDVGGVGGFIDFHKIMLDPEHEEHMQMKEWSENWKVELEDWEHSPRVIRV